MEAADREDKMNNIYLIGFMGTGKTTVAKALAQKLNMDVMEMDDAIEAARGHGYSAYISAERRGVVSEGGDRRAAGSGCTRKYGCFLRRRRSAETGKCGSHAEKRDG